MSQPGDQKRLLETLRQLLEIPAVDLPSALERCADFDRAGLGRRQGRRLSLRRGARLAGRGRHEPAAGIENLLSNALKHSPRGAPVSVRLSRVLHDGQFYVHIEVADRGPGIPAEVLPHIFDRFVTAEGKEGGLGLGLYLAKRVALLHGGTLSVESQPGEGARFTLALPCPREDA